MTTPSSGHPPVEGTSSITRADPPHLSEPRLLTKIRYLLVRPWWTLSGLVLIAAFIEFAQYWPEVIPGGHALGEIVRNLAYALIGAVIFHWAVVEYPDSRRRLRAYAHHELDLQLLAITGLGLLNQTRHYASVIGLKEDVDAWDQVDVQRVCADVWRFAGPAYQRSRHAMLGFAVMGVSTALDGLARSSPFFDADVTQAIAQFPSTTGIHQLQLLAITDPDQALRDGHIVWELLEGARRLHRSLRASASYVDLKIEGANVEFPDGTRIYHRVEDLHRP